MTYQFLPDLSADDYAALKADIATRGVMVPVEYDDEGNILDGHHRVKICGELGIAEWPRIVRSFESEADKRTHARQLNLSRRHLNQEQRRALIAEDLLERPERSNRQIADDLGVSHPTVAAVRSDLEATGKIYQLEKTVGADGKARTTSPARKPAVSSIHLPGSDGGAAIRSAANKAHAAQKAERKEERQRETAELAEMLGTATSRYDLYNEPCANVLNGDAESVDWIITDPPYPREFLPLYDTLAEIADHALKPGASLLCMIGHYYLPDVLSSLSKRLNYHWTLAYLTPGGQATQVFPRKVNTFWKPILWFVKGDYAGDWIGDVARSQPNDNDKRFHDWGQSESGMLDLMSRFVKPGDRVLDPFMGAGTTGVAALELGATFVGFDNDVSAFNEAVVRLDRASFVL